MKSVKNSDIELENVLITATGEDCLELIRNDDFVSKADYSYLKNIEKIVCDMDILNKLNNADIDRILIQKTI